MIQTSDRLDLAAIRANHPLANIVGATIRLIRAGAEWKACCPFHDDRSPSFTIFSGGERFHCFGCQASGDALDYVQRLHGVSLQEAAAMLEGGELPTVPVRAGKPVAGGRSRTAEAIAIWDASVSAAGTPAEAYLRRRGLHLPLPPSIRFSRLALGRREPMPCLIARVNRGDRQAAIQRTFLTEDGRKADLPDGKVKFSLGPVRGGAIRLAPAAAELVVTGGLEDGLTLQQQLGLPVWAATGEGNMASLLLPDIVRSIVIGADGDESGERHARAAAEAFSERGLRARIIRPAAGHKDFNSELLGDAA